MAPLIIIKPETAIKRAEGNFLINFITLELINVGQSLTALQILHEAMISKKYRNYADSHKVLMLRLIELCVDLNKGKLAREALHAFKNLCQTAVSFTPLEIVINRFIELSEKKVASVQLKDIALSIEDLEASESPESILTKMLTGDCVTSTSKEKEVVMFLWEAYRSLLDVLKNNSKLEILYQKSAQKAFDFCIKYKRKTEMRRLCETLRNHLTSLSKYSNQTNIVNLNSPESLQIQLETRFDQLNAATKLELWQEAFRSVEDIYGLIAGSKITPKNFMMVNFYEQLVKIFLVSENYLFHAAAWYKYYMTFIALNQGDEGEVGRIAGMVLLSALVVPANSTSEQQDDDERVKSMRLASLLNMYSVPTRSSLLKDIIAKGLLKKSPKEVQDLYEMIEVKFHPLSITKTVEPLMVKLADCSAYEPYIKPLYKVILHRILLQLSQVYTNISLDTIFELAEFPEPFKWTKFEIETFILVCCRKGELDLKIDHRNKTLLFNQNVFKRLVQCEGPQLQSLPSVKLRSFMTVLQERLEAAIKMLDAKDKKGRGEEELHTRKIEALKKRFEEERSNVLKRKELIELKKEQHEAAMLQKEQKESQERALRLKQEEEAEKKRLEEESRRREIERLKKEREEIERQQALKLAEELKKKNVDIEAEKLENLDRDKLLQIQLQQVESEKKQLRDKLESLAKRIDHTERAYRKEEVPLIEKRFKEKIELDKVKHEEAYVLLVEATKKKHELDLKTRDQLVRMKEDFNSFKNRIKESHEDKMKEIRNKSKTELEIAIEKRKTDLKEKKKEELERKKQEEELVKKQKQEELLRKQQEEKQKAEKEEELRKFKNEKEEEMLKAQEEARLKLQREEEALQRRQSKKEEAKENEPKKYVPPSMRAKTASNGSYVPPHLKKSASGASTDSVDNRFSALQNDGNAFGSDRNAFGNDRGERSGFNDRSGSGGSGFSRNNSAFSSGAWGKKR